MTTASDIIHGALKILGAHSRVNPADPELVADSLPYLQSLLAELSTKEIDISATSPTGLTDDLSESAGATSSLKNILAIDIAPITRTPPERMQIGPGRSINRSTEMHKLSQQFFNPTIPNIVPSVLLPRGQGAERGPHNDAFFGGVAIQDDVTE